MRLGKSQRLMLMGCWIIQIGSAALGATTFNISVGDNFFTPSSRTISLGDSVKWTWISDNLHSTTSDTLIWDSGTGTNGMTFTQTFVVAGNFPFHCSEHNFMAGAVHVPAGNTPPSVSITNPANGMVFSEPATILLQVTASDPGGSVTNVQFVQATTILTNQTVSPYFTLVSNLVAGIYTFSAIASDNKGATATNTISVSVVAPVEIILSSPQSVFGTNFQFDYSANAGLKYVVERSANLTAWNVLSTNVAASNTVTFVHTNTPVSPGFYRVGRLPNP